MLAIAGDLALTLALGAPWFAIIFFGVVIANRVFFYWVGAAAFAFFIWVMRPTFRVSGRELTRKEAPALFSELDTLHRKLRVPGRMEVLLDAEFNASAAETLGLFGVLGTRRTLTLGMPLLALLTREELLAVIAHEYGHFSHRHGRLGHWLYRARVGWIKYADYIGDSNSAFERAAARYANRFVPYFSARSFVYSRQCEYEADADAALAVGAEVFAAALTRIAVCGQFLNEEFQRQLIAWQADSPEPPPNFHERLVATAQKATAQASLANALQDRSVWSDTHPSVSARLGALNQNPRLPDSGPSAGSSLFGKAWSALIREFDNKWAQQIQSDWALEHFKLKHVTKTLIDAKQSSIEAWPVEKQLARARALRRIEPAKGLLELRRLHERHPSNARVAFAYASALLRDDDAAGIQIMVRVAKDDAVLRLPACERLIDYYERVGDMREAARYSKARQTARQRERRAIHKFFTDLENGNAAPSLLPEDAKQVLRDTLGSDSAVTRAWLFSGHSQLEISAARSLALAVHALVLVVDPALLKARDDDESRIAERYQRALRSFIHPDEVAVVRTFFITEPIPQPFALSSNALLCGK